MYRDEGLVAQAESFRNGANTHWLTSTLHKYYNTGVDKYKHLYEAAAQDKYEAALRLFVSNKGVFREMTKAEEDAVYKAMGWKK